MQKTWVWSLGKEDPPGEGNGNPFQYSCLGNPMDKGARRATVHRVTKSQIWQSMHTHTRVGSLFGLQHIPSVQFSSVTQPCPTLWDPMNCSTPGFPVHHHLPELAQTHVHQVSDSIQPSHLLSSPSAFSLPASGSFPVSQFFASGGQSIGASASVLPMNTQDSSPLGWTGWISLQSSIISYFWKMNAGFI